MQPGGRCRGCPQTQRTQRTGQVASLSNTLQGLIVVLGMGAELLPVPLQALRPAPCAPAPFLSPLPALWAQTRAPASLSGHRAQRVCAGPFHRLSPPSGTGFCHLPSSFKYQLKCASSILPPWEKPLLQFLQESRTFVVLVTEAVLNCWNIRSVLVFPHSGRGLGTWSAWLTVVPHAASSA